MKAHHIQHLEVISCKAEKPLHTTPLLFIHGAFANARCFENYLPFFAQRGWNAHALSLSGHGHSKDLASLDACNIDQYIEDVLTVAHSLPSPPVLIGWSMGGFIVQKLLEKETVPAVVLISPVPPEGMSAMTLSMMSKGPNVMWAMKKTFFDGDKNIQSVQNALFANPIDEVLLKRYAQEFVQSESMRAIWDMTFFNLPNIPKMHRPPMLVLGGEDDQIISIDLTRKTAKTYGLEAETFPSMGHGIMLEMAWQAPALRIDAWLKNDLAVQ